MGRAILPSRLKEERKIVAERVKDGKDLNENPSVAKHASWLNQFQDRFNGKQSLKEIDFPKLAENIKKARLPGKESGY